MIMVDGLCTVCTSVVVIPSTPWSCRPDQEEGGTPVVSVIFRTSPLLWIVGRPCFGIRVVVLEVGALRGLQALSGGRLGTVDLRHGQIVLGDGASLLHEVARI